MFRPRKQARIWTRLPVAAEGGRLVRLVGQNILDAVHDLRRELWQELERLAVVFDLGDFGRAQDDGRDVLVHHAPGRWSAMIQALTCQTK